MKQRLLVVVCFLLAVGPLGALSGAERANLSQPLRNWQSSNGKYTISARLVELKDQSVVLEKTDGQRITVPLEKLSEPDRRHVARVESERAPRPEADEGDSSSPTPGPPTIADTDRPGRVLTADDFAALLKPRKAPQFEKAVTLSGHKEPITALAFSTNAKFLASADAQGNCIVWSVADGKEIGRLQELKPLEKTLVAVSPDGRLAAVAGNEPGVTAWEVATGQVVYSHRAPQQRVTHLAMPGDVPVVISADGLGNLHRYPARGGEGNSVGGSSGALSTVAAADDGLFIIFVEGRKRKLELASYQEPRPAFYSLPLRYNESVTSAVGKTCFAIAFSNGRVVTYLLPKPGGNEYMNTHFGLRSFNAAEQLIFTDDDRQLVAVSRDGQFEFRPLVFDLESQVVTLRTIDSSVMAYSAADGILAAQAEPDGRIVISRLNGRPHLPVGALLALPPELLQQKQYDSLAALEQFFLENSEVKKILGSMTLLPAYNCLLWSFKPYLVRYKGDLVEDMQAWHEARPQATLPRVFLADRLVDEAWEARGSGFAGSVTEEGWRVFYEKLDAAQQMIAPVLEAPRVPPPAFTVALGIAKGQGWAAERRQKVLDRLWAQAPHQAEAHCAMAVTLLPRWHGEPGDSHQYALDVAERIGGDKGKMIYAQIALELYCYHSGKSLFEELGFDYKKVNDGLLAILKEVPEEDFALNRGLQFAQIVDDRESARFFAKRMKDLGDPWLDSVWRHGVHYRAALAYAFEEDETKSP